MFSGKDVVMLNRLHEIAFLAHHYTGETRGGMDNLPYYIHVVQVAGEVAEVVPDLPPVFLHPYSPAQVIGAAIVHDVPEDTDPHWTDAILAVDKGVHELALMLKNGHMELPPDEIAKLGRADKKKLDFEKMADPARFHQAAIPIKYKDRKHNLLTSTHWRKDRQLRYAVEETPQLLKVLDERMGSHPNYLVQAVNTDLKQEILAAIEVVKERAK